VYPKGEVKVRPHMHLPDHAGGTSIVCGGELARGRNVDLNGRMEQFMPNGSMTQEYCPIRR